MYELRDSSWFDRGTGYCRGIYDDSQDLALLVVEAEDTGAEKPGDAEAEGEGGFLKEDLLLTARVEKEDIYVRQQGRSRNYPIMPCDHWLIDRHADRMDGTDFESRYSVIFPGFRGVRGYLAVYSGSPEASQQHSR